MAWRRAWCGLMVFVGSLLTDCNRRVTKDETEGILCAVPEDDLCGYTTSCHEAGEWGDPLAADFEGLETSFDADSPALFELFYDTGAPCVDEISGTCDVTLEGNLIRLHAEASWLVHDDCFCDQCYSTFVWVRCETPPLAAGGYTVSLGCLSFSFAVPSERSSACFND